MAIDVLILTALLDELDALKTHVGQAAWTPDWDRHGFPYDCATHAGQSIAAAWIGDMGEAATADRARALVDALEPAALAMCGICAGRRGTVFLGDVIIADRVFSYDHGKMVAATDGDPAQFCHDIRTYNLRETWKMDAEVLARTPDTWAGTWREARPLSLPYQEAWLLRQLRADAAAGRETGPDSTHCPDWARVIERLEKLGRARVGRRLVLTEAGARWADDQAVRYPDGAPADPAFRAHVGPIATGKAVQEDAELFPRLAQFVRKVIGVEMEAAAIGLVAERSGIPSIVVKAVSDHADDDKDDRFRGFACRASAAFLLAFLAQRSARRAVEVDPGGPIGRLAELYHQADDFRRVMSIAGMPTAGIDFNAAPRVVAFRMWEEAGKVPDGRARLLAAVRTDGYAV